MAKNGGRGSFDVVGDEKIAALHSGESARDSEKPDGGARARAERKRGPIARAAHQR